MAIEPNLSVNWIDLPEGKFTSTLVGNRATYTFTPRMFVAALVQYTSSTTSVLTNVRFRWEYRPGSVLYFVWAQERTQDTNGVKARIISSGLGELRAAHPANVFLVKGSYWVSF